MILFRFHDGSGVVKSFNSTVIHFKYIYIYDDYYLRSSGRLRDESVKRLYSRRAPRSAINGVAR